MSQNQTTSYFTDYELSSIFNKTCPKSEKKRHFFSERNCCIGSLSHGSDGNLWEHPSYCTQKINYTLRLKYPHKREAYTMKDVFWALKNRSTIILLGDSVQNQVFDGMTCDLLRNNITLETLSDINMNKLSTNWTFKEGKIGFKYTLIPNRRHNRTFKAFKLNSDNITVTHMVNVLYLRTYRPNIFQYKRFCEWADVYLLNWDLHYDLDRTSEKYELWKEEIGGILKLIENCFRMHIKTKESLPIFIWRGTAAQHFNHFGGYYEHGVIYNEPNKNSIENAILLSNIDDKYREWELKNMNH